MSLLSRTSAAAIAVALLAAPLALPAVAQDAAKAPTEGAAADAATAEVNLDHVLAVVNGKSVTVGHLLSVIADLPPQYQQLPDDVLFDGVLEQMVQQLVLSDNLTELTPVESLAIDNQERAVRAGLAIQRILAADVTDEEIKAAYDQLFADAEPEKEFNAAHILVATEDEAKAIVEELAKGGDFAAIAKEKSTDPGSGANGGELGWFGLGMMVPEFENAVTALEEGKVSEPVQSQFGWHVILLKESRLVEQPSLEDLRGQLADQVRNQKVEAAIEAATAGATIDRTGREGIATSVVRRGDLLGK